MAVVADSLNVSSLPPPRIKMSWTALYTNVVWTTATTLQSTTRDHQPMCYSSEGYHPISSLRVFDFSPCFEALAILPVPLVGLILCAGIDLANIKRKGPKKKRDGWSAWRMWMKTVCLFRVFSPGFF
jgi:hypothetical protein